MAQVIDGPKQWSSHFGILTHPSGNAVTTETVEMLVTEPMYSVLLLNDDHTPMEFVVLVLERFFDKDHETAMQIMQRAHNDGATECGVYTHELAKTKVTQVSNFAREHQHPLQCVLERSSVG